DVWPGERRVPASRSCPLAGCPDRARSRLPLPGGVGDGVLGGHVGHGYWSDATLGRSGPLTVHQSAQSSRCLSNGYHRDAASALLCYSHRCPVSSLGLGGRLARACRAMLLEGLLETQPGHRGKTDHVQAEKPVQAQRLLLDGEIETIAIVPGQEHFTEAQPG